MVVIQKVILILYRQAGDVRFKCSYYVLQL